MDLLDSAEPPRTTSRGAGLVAVALGLLAVAQAYAVQVPDLPSGIELAALDTGYTAGALGTEDLLVFQLSSTGREVTVEGVGEDVPGLQLLDVTALGEATGGRQVGAGPDPFPEIELPEGVLVLALRYRATECLGAGDARTTVPVRIAAGRARGTVLVPLRGYPDEAPDGTQLPDLSWSQQLARGVCGSS